MKYLFLKQKINDEIKVEISQVYGDSETSLQTIKYWKSELKGGCRLQVVKSTCNGLPTKAPNNAT